MLFYSLENGLVVRNINRINTYNGYSWLHFLEKTIKRIYIYIAHNSGEIDFYDDIYIYLLRYIPDFT